MNTKDNLNDKFYDFINMYNVIIKHCSNQNRHYDINLLYVQNKLYFKVIDTNSKNILHNCTLNCSHNESKLIYNLITNEFILNHHLKYAAYIPMSSDDVLLYQSLLNNKVNIFSKNEYYQNFYKPMQIHSLKNTNFTLNIYQYEGIDEQTELLHQMALEKINSDNEKVIQKNRNSTRDC